MIRRNPNGDLPVVHDTAFMVAEHRVLRLIVLYGPYIVRRYALTELRCVFSAYPYLSHVAHIEQACGPA